MTHPTVVWITYVAFVVYGSLVPLDFQPLPLDRAWALFSHISLLSIDLEGRADWIANGVLYAPVGFLTATMFAGPEVNRLRLSRFVLALFGGWALAVGVEFVQLFFPPRTVSLNDVLAEWVGTSIGAVIAVFLARHRVDAFSRVARLDVRQLVPYLTTVYVAAYLIVSLFPYDFLMSGGEVDRKINSDSWGWFLAAKTLAGGGLAIVVKLAAEALVVVPFGLLLGQRSAGRQGFPGGFVLGAILGLVVESAQWFVFSGISQGASVLTRGIGVGIGAVLWRDDWTIAQIRVWAKQRATWLGLAYLLALPTVGGWFSHRWGGMDLAAQKLAAVRFVPFYYHYYTSEAVALVSVVAVCLMYAPIGLLAWAMRASPAKADMAAGFAAFAVEVGKLFIDGAHPDPTDVLIAGAIAWLVVAVANRLADTQTHSAVPDAESASQGRRQADASCGLRRDLPESRVSSTSTAGGLSIRDGKNAREWRHPPPAAWAGLIVVGMLLVWTVADFPLFPGLLGIFLLAYGIAAWRYPASVVAVVPAALPVLDLAPWSGRFFFDEFDMLLAVGLTVGYARTPAPRRDSFRDRVFLIVAALVAVSYLIGCLRGMLPWQGINPNSFTNYYSPFNALRIAKGALWAFLLYGLLYRISATGRDARRLFAWGMVVGLAGTVAVVIWERFVFSGLFNFANDYRVTGPFSQAYVGSAYIEGFLTAATPFLVMWLASHRGRLVFRISALVLLLAATYALMVTFSRSGYVAYFVGLSIVASVAWGPSLWRHGVSMRRGVAVALTIVLLLAVATPVFRGQFATERMSQVGGDLGLRLAHWRDTLGMLSSGWVAAFLGEGIGRYPETHHWRSSEVSRAAIYQLGTDSAGAFLRLGHGSALYMEQFVSIDPNQRYQLSFNVRAAKPHGAIKIWLCEKWSLASYECYSKIVELGNTVDLWQRQELLIDPGAIGRGTWYTRRPVKFSFSNPSASSAVDVTNIRLETAGRQNLLDNGGFVRGLDHWFFTVDNYWPWHIESLPLVVLFDLGWLGATAVALLLALALWRAIGNSLRGDLGSGASLAALVGFLLVGILNSLIDTPRFLMLFLLLIWFAQLGGQSVADLDDGNHRPSYS